jgi:hypothetical protein
MDKELATAVFKRWAGGQPVAETTFHKAASALGLNPDDALLEARFYTCLDYDLKKVASGHRLDDVSVRLYSMAAGLNTRDMVKTASAYGLPAQNLAFEMLARNNWVPNLPLLKVAMMAPVMADGGAGDAGAPMMDPAAAGGDAAAPAGAEGEPPPPDPNAQVQQDPMRRFKPSPMAPVQSPPSQEGNLQELAMAARHPEQGQMAGMGGMGGDPMGGMESAAGPMDPAPPMPPDQKLLAVQQNIPAEALNRWAGKFSELEKQVGMSIDDPAQIGKFIAQMQKDDAKMVDEAIKNMAVQTAPVRPTIQQQAAQQQGQGGGGGGAPPGGGGGQPPPPAAAGGGGAPPADPNGAPPQKKPAPKPAPQQQQQPQQQQKVAARRVWLPNQS